MAEKAKYIRKDGTTCIVTAKEAARIPKAERDFLCIGKDPHGKECGKEVSLVKREGNGKTFLYFRGKEHIRDCDLSCSAPDVTVYIDAMNDFTFDAFFHYRDDGGEGGNPPGPGGRDRGGNNYDDVEEDDRILGVNERPRNPKGVKTLYGVLSFLPLHAVIDGKEVGEILVTREAIAQGYTELEGDKVLTVERCKPPEDFERNTSQIVVRVCEMEETFLVLNVPEKELRQKVWDLIFPDKSTKTVARKNGDSLPKVLVAGRVSRLQENIYACDVLDGRMVAKLK